MATTYDVIWLIQSGSFVLSKEQVFHLVLNLCVAGMSSAIVEYAELCKFSGFG